MAEELSRRKLLKTGSIGIVGGVAALSGLDRLSSIPALLPESQPNLSAVGSDVVAHVRDASTGDVSIMVGDREVVSRDPQLVGHLLAAARQANREG